MTALLSLHRVGRSFGGLRALNEVSLEVSEGEVVGIMGANGAGKTTLFSLIAGNLRPNSGDILLRGQSIVGLSPDRICRRGIARTFQIVRPFGGLTVLENVTIPARFGSARSDAKAARAIAEEALRMVGLLARRDEIASSLTLSGQKRLELARAVATGAHIVLLDEVMAGLTATEVAEMLAIIRGLRERHGLTVLIIEHVMRALMEISERVLVLHHGEAIAIGAPAAVAADPAVLACYFGDRA